MHAADLGLVLATLPGCAVSGERCLGWSSFVGLQCLVDVRVVILDEGEECCADVAVLFGLGHPVDRRGVLEEDDVGVAALPR